MIKIILILFLIFIIFCMFNNNHKILFFIFIVFSNLLVLNIDIRLKIIINSILIIIFLLIIYRYMLINNKLSSISDKYLDILDSFNEYESMMDKYKILNHENKNQLLTIRSMVIENENNIPEYIDALIDTTIKDNEKLMFETTVIPSGGLRAIIYSKMAYMSDKGIKPILEVDKCIRRIDLSNINDELIINICKILGVFLDNAIEEVLKLDKKEIKIKLFIENNNLCITIKNKFFNNFDINKIDNCGFSTKGNNHGYGLTLVKNIINENPNKLINNKYIDNNYFVQNLEIIDIF